MEYRDLVGETVLVFDDEVHAVEMEGTLADAGAIVLTATNAEEAGLLADDAAVSLAVLVVKPDNNKSCQRVCVRLAELGIPFVFYTASIASPLFDLWPNATVIAQPASRAMIIEALKASAIGSVTEAAGALPAAK